MPNQFPTPISSLFISLLLQLILFTCSHPNKEAKKAGAYQNNDSSQSLLQNEDKTSPDTKNKKHIEVLDLDIVLYDGKVPYSSSPKELLAALGEPDSITDILNECGAYVPGEEPWGDKIDNWHYNGSEFAVFRDQAEIMVISFQDIKTTLEYPGIIFSQKTTIDELSDKFPGAVENSYEITTEPANKKYLIVRLFPTPDYDDLWVFWFYQGELEKIIYWVGC